MNSGVVNLCRGLQLPEQKANNKHPLETHLAYRFRLLEIKTSDRYVTSKICYWLLAKMVSNTISVVSWIGNTSLGIYM